MQQSGYHGIVDRTTERVRQNPMRNKNREWLPFVFLLMPGVRKQQNDYLMHGSWLRVRMRTVLLYAAIVPALLGLNFRERFYVFGHYPEWNWGWPIAWYSKGNGSMFETWDEFLPIGIVVDIACAIAILGVVHWLSERRQRAVLKLIGQW